jgi:dihydrofolate reductase
VSEPRARPPIEIVLVAAVAENGVIGRDGALPWRLKTDMQSLRATTWGKPVVVGRKTFLSFTKKPLPGRTNIVVSRNPSFAAVGALVDTIIVLGGADIYAQTMAIADRLLITRVHLQPNGDAKFPAIDPDIWRQAQRSEHHAGPDDDADFTTLVYERRAAGAESPDGRR